MTRSILFFFELVLLILILISNLYAEELTIIPIKKPILDKITIEQKITQGIIKPKSKPILESKSIKLSDETIKPESKPTEKTKIIENLLAEIQYQGNYFKILWGKTSKF